MFVKEICTSSTCNSPYYFSLSAVQTAAVIYIAFVIQKGVFPKSSPMEPSLLLWLFTFKGHLYLDGVGEGMALELG